jgi:hypothetical protein
VLSDGVVPVGRQEATASPVERARSVQLACADSKVTYQLRDVLGPTAAFVVVAAVCPVLAKQPMVMAVLQAGGALVSSYLTCHLFEAAGHSD